VPEGKWSVRKVQRRVHPFPSNPSHLESQLKYEQQVEELTNTMDYDSISHASILGACHVSHYVSDIIRLLPLLVTFFIAVTIQGDILRTVALLSPMFQPRKKPYLLPAGGRPQETEVAALSIAADKEGILTLAKQLLRLLYPPGTLSTSLDLATITGTLPDTKRTPRHHAVIRKVQTPCSDVEGSYTMQ